MIVIDTDGHVQESEAMFNMMEKDYYPRRPLAIGFNGKTDTAYGKHNAFWLIDGEIYPKIVGRGVNILGTPTIMEFARAKGIPIPSQELTDVPTRLRDLDAMRIDKQVIFPTLFLTTTAEDIGLEAALMRCYNNFMADACRKSKGRLSFAAIVPIRDVEESVRELERAKGLGAGAVMLHGVAWDKRLGHKAHFPFYEQAAKLDLPVAIHFGWGSPVMARAMEHPYGGDVLREVRTTQFSNAAVPVITGFHNIMTAGVMETFRELRMAFLEVGSHWLPYVLHQLRRSTLVSRDPAEYFREGRAFVACEADEDINYITSWVGEDSLIVASDYPHGDASHEEHMVDAIMAREDVPVRVREKILSANAERLFKI